MRTRPHGGWCARDEGRFAGSLTGPTRLESCARFSTIRGSDSGECRIRTEVSGDLLPSLAGPRLSFKRDRDEGQVEGAGLTPRAGHSRLRRFEEKGAPGFPGAEGVSSDSVEGRAERRSASKFESSRARSRADGARKGSNSRQIPEVIGAEVA